MLLHDGAFARCRIGSPALKTRAVQDGNHWVINGEKWFITGADGAGFAIVMAAGEDGRATMFLADMATSGIEVVRTMDSLDQGFPAATAWCGCTTCACRQPTFWASRAKGSATRRCGWHRHD